jgi:Ca-activated chloride channel homolog
VQAEAVLTPPVNAAVSDYFTLDDKAYAVYNPPQSGRVLFLSSTGNIYIEQLLAAFSGVQPFRAPLEAPLPSDPFDLYIYDGGLSETLPAAELLLINPPSNDLFPVGEEVTPEADSTISVADDELLKFVDLSNVHILKFRETQTPAWARTLVSMDGKPLIFYGTLNRHRLVVFTFDLRDTDLPLQVAYPILMSNLIEWLTPSTVIAADETIHPGDSVTIRPAVGEQVVGIVAPDDSVFTADVTNAGALFADTYQLGIYGVGTASAVEGTKFAGLFAVNLFSPLESHIAPAETLTVGRSEIDPSLRDQLGQREFWPYVAAVALLILLIEWWVYHRGSSVPKIGGWRGWFNRKKVGA